MLRLASKVHELVVRTGALPVHRVHGVTVVSVGALTVGGAGKTPVAMALARRAHEDGCPVALVLRGFGGTASREGALVSDGTRLLSDATRAGDEAVLHARRLPGVLVRIGADRVEAARRARADGARLVILDDGFQHRRLARDLDVVCLGAEGLRREGDAALARAGLVFAIDRAPPSGISCPVISARTVATALVRGPTLELAGDPRSLRGVRVALACAIAQPHRFTRMVEALGAHVVSSRSRHDHARLAPGDLLPPRGVDLVLVTEKDLVKLDDPQVLALRVEVEVATS